jgi:hypothetical protein
LDGFERVERRIGGRQHLDVEALEERAGQKLRRAQLFGDGVEVEVGGLLREPRFHPEELLEGKIQPQARRGAAKEIIMAGEDAPDLARILQLGVANLQIFQRDSLAIEHPVDVVIGLDEELCRVGERLVFRKPGRLRMPVRADDGQVSNVCVQRFGNLAHCGFGGKQTVFMNQHDGISALWLEDSEVRPPKRSDHSIHIWLENRQDEREYFPG